MKKQKQIHTYCKHETKFNTCSKETCFLNVDVMETHTHTEWRGGC